MPVRLPAHRGLTLIKELLKQGVKLHENKMPALNELIAESGIEAPLCN